MMDAAPAHRSPPSAIPEGLDWLYRYRPYLADELRLLLTAGQIRFSDARRFNDPWDCRPQIRIPEGIPGEDERWIQWYVDILVRDGALAAEETDAKKHVYQEKPKQLRADIYARNPAITERVRSLYRMLCLSEHHDAPLMWSHYARSHTGICQVFDTKNPVVAEAQKVFYLPFYAAIDFPDPDYYLVLHVLTTKAGYWKYEDE